MLTFTFMIDRTMGPGVSFSFARQVGTVEPGFFAFILAFSAMETLEMAANAAGSFVHELSPF